MPSLPLLGAADIARAIEAVKGTASVLMIHSSLPALAGSQWSVDRWQLVQAMRRLVRAGNTLLFPAFTFSYTKGRPFDINGSPSETGILADWIRDLPEARRTPNPIFSFVLLGPEAPALLAADHRDAYGPRSVLAALDRYDSAVVMLGAAWDFCTYLHKMEEEHQVPYRKYKTFTTSVDLGNGLVDPQLHVFVRDEDILTALDFGIVGRTAREDGLIRSHPLGAGTVEGIFVPDLARHCRERLSDNPCFLLRDSPAVAHQLAVRAARSAQPPFRIALVGSANLAPLRAAVNWKLRMSAPARTVESYATPFASERQEIRDPHSSLHRFDPHITVFVETLETLAGTAHVDLVDQANLEHRLADWLDGVELWAKSTKGKFLVFDPIQCRPTFVRRNAPSDDNLAVAQALQRLRDIVSRYNGSLIETSPIVAAMSEPVFDPRTWYLGRIGFSDAFNQAVAHQLARYVASETGQSVRAILLDLDDTLWGGIAAEDGIEGINVGGDFPGNAFADFQRALKALSKQGIVLALVSKNDEDVAFRVLEQHPGMVLRREDFATWAIGWNSKVEGITEIARRLNLDLSNLLFIDDNPVEREAVRRALPAVTVLDIGRDVAGYLDALLTCPLMPITAATKEDFGRSASLRRFVELGSLKERPEDFAAFLKSLNVRVHLAKLVGGAMSRAEQLMAKTNQFNSTVRRYNAAALVALQNEGAQILTITVSDRFNEPEILGLIVMQDQPSPYLDSIVLSCRAFGKGVEVAVLRHLARTVLEKSGVPLSVAFTPVARNYLVSKTLREAGFRPSGSDWVFDTYDVRETTVRVTEEPTGSLARAVRAQ